MNRISLSIIFINLLFTSTWQNISSEKVKPTKLEVLASSIESTTLSFNIEGFHLMPVEIPNDLAYKVQLKDGASLLEAGSPDMHKFARSIIIPNDKDMGVRIINAEYIDYESITLAPSKGNITRNIDPDSLPFEYNSTYNQNNFFPGKIVDLEVPYILRDFRGQSIVFYPFQYNPVQNLLRVYNKIEVEIYSLGISQTNVLEDEKPFDKTSKEYANIYENHFLNFSINDSRFDYLVDHGNMLVISYGSFIETVQPLVDWKNRKGIPTEIVNIGDIGTSSSSISNYVENYYNTNGLTFLLLVGDIAQMPSPSVSGSASDVSYGCILGNDFYPEVIVGRLSGSTPNQIATQVDRSINYERYPQTGAEWYDNALGVASNQGPGFGGYSDDDFNDFMWNTVLSDFTYDSYQGIYDGSGGTASQGINAINSGVGIINYTGHGSISSWGNGAPLSNSNVNSLTNNNMLPFVITVGCNVGEFNSTNECYTEAWLRATNGGEPTGAISHFGSTISQSWEPPMHGQYGMNLILTESYNDNLTRTMGGITTNGCMYMNDAQGSSGINETKYWTYFGDPSVPIRTAPPSEISAVYDDVIILGSSDFTVSTGTEGDLVALSKNGELIASGYTDRFGSVALQLGEQAQVPGELDIVITGFNYIPHESTVMVLSPEGPYVMASGSSILSGFDDIIEYGEAVEFSVILENVGNDGANGVLIEISTNDPYITITNDNAYTNYIAPNGSVNVSGLAFDVSGNIPNNHTIEIQSIISTTGSMNNEWLSNLYFTAYAPELSIDAVIGDLDPGESADISAFISNVGGAQITYPFVVVQSDEYITINSSSFSNAYSLEVGMEATLDLNVSVNQNTPIGHLANFDVAIVANLGDGPITNTSFEIPIGQVIANFESGLGSLDWGFSCNGVGCNDWDDSNTESHTGSGSAQSGAIGNSSSSDMSVTLDITADGEIDFYYKVSAEYSTSGSYFYDGLEFYIDNTLKGQYQTTTSGDSPWTHVSYPVTAGEHTFRWSYVKDGGGGSTDCDNTNCADAAWIDDITFPPAYMESAGMPGDVNMDDIINILDVIVIINMILGVEDQNTLADLNGDGSINIQDIILVINLILGDNMSRAHNIIEKVQIDMYSDKLIISSDGTIAGVELHTEGDYEITDSILPEGWEYFTDNDVIVMVDLEGRGLEGPLELQFEGNLMLKENIISDWNGNACNADIYVPSKVSLDMPYPNPFNPTTSISYDIAQDSYVKLNIYNLSGQLVEVLVDNKQVAGHYTMTWDANGYSSGIYFVRLETSQGILKQNLMLMK